MRRTLALLAGSALLTGCGGSSHDIADGPSSAPPAATSSPASPTTSPTTTAPTHETAKQFIRRWQKTADAMQLSGDTSAFDALNDSGCQSCATFKQSVAEVYARGGQIETTPTEILWIHQQSGRRYYVHERAAATRYRESAKGPWKTFPGGEVTQVVDLMRLSSGWRLAAYSQLAEDPS